jgi:hypothetical protein
MERRKASTEAGDVLAVLAALAGCSSPLLRRFLLADG